ncbi:MAG TPA: DUF1573 domain-containing protein, partial [Bacteroidales bacterium]|nr:DUF1573 domain-containing protein [Bacteroidales bacterium]HPT22699.1 DUF1573 domain-containing protein [Bacteroidales bacterium]
MNKFLSTIFLFTLLLFSACNNTAKKEALANAKIAGDTGTAVIVFNEYEHAFGKVAEGEKVAYTFNFENKGTGNLVIASATTTCGCTVPKYDTKPISPDNKGSLEVVFDTSGRNGMQTKTITVRSNASVPVVLLKITAEVISD